MVPSSENADPQRKLEGESSGSELEKAIDEVILPVEGMYILKNKKSRTNLDIVNGSPQDGARIYGYEPSAEDKIGSQLWIVERDGPNETFTLRNLQSGTYVDLVGGPCSNGSPVAGYSRALSASQEWRIKERELDHYTIQCSQTETYLEIPGGKPNNSLVATCSAAEIGNDHQVWCFEPVSCTSTTLLNLFQAWKPEIKLYAPSGESIQYFLLPSQLYRNVWRNTGLLRQPMQNNLFDHSGFVMCMKNAVTTWVRSTYGADIRGYSVLFGIIYGNTPGGPRAFNWYLSPDLGLLVFFDALSGK
ncbi:hypothetical protein FRB90_007465, partial [Tulasnella sp. 427]